MKENKARSKRNHMVINLIETPSGYSVIEGTQLLNKTQTPVPVAPVQAQAPVSQSQSAALQAPSQSIPMPILMKQPSKTTIKQNNLLFLKSPNNCNINSQNLTGDRVSNVVLKNNASKQLKSFASWFSFETVSQFEKAEIESWLVEWGFIINNSILQNYFKKYHSHRNTIIKLYLQNYHKSGTYLSASTIRKHICQDARYLMKIHIFLTSHGLLNTNKINIENENVLFSFNLHKLNENKYDVLSLSSSYYTEGPHQWNRSQQAQNYLALKNITKSIRPYCDYCGIHCQIVWFQHMRIMDPKEIVNIMKNVNSKNPPLSEKQYEIILCIKCYCNGNFPLLLTQHDFRKITINDHIQGKRKNKRKSKRKDKKGKHKERVVQEEEEYKEEVEQMQQQPKQAPKQQQQAQQQNEEPKPQKLGTNPQQNTANHQQLNGIKAPEQLAPQTSEIEKQTLINEAISRIINEAKKQKIWTFQQTLKLLNLVQQYEQDWDQIYYSMRQAGFCKDCSPQDLIMYFVRLPQLNVSNLIQQNSDQCFISQNKMLYKSDYLMKKVQNNFDNSIKIHRQLRKQKQGKDAVLLPKKQGNQIWKQLLNRFVKLHINKLDQRVENLENVGKIALLSHKKFDQVSKEIIGAEKMG